MRNEKRKKRMETKKGKKEKRGKGRKIGKGRGEKAEEGKVGVQIPIFTVGKTLLLPVARRHTLTEPALFYSCINSSHIKSLYYRQRCCDVLSVCLSVCVSLCLSVCLCVCMLVSRISQQFFDRFEQNFME